tara:strand:+ start:36515 stop:37441 length:927 start_codon:yes stop_codon:yes gene_type:complete
MILSGDDPVPEVAQTIAETRADVIGLTSVDYDHDLITLGALRDAVRGAGGWDYQYLAAVRPNTGLATDLDLDGDGRLGGRGDAQGFGDFAGQGGMAVLSRWPLVLRADHSQRLWRDIPDSLLIDAAGVVGEAAVGADVQRLSYVSHWEVSVHPPDRPPILLMLYHASPPVFDGPEDRNGRRNHDETMFWLQRLDGAFGPPPTGPFIIMGAANLSPDGGDGRSQAMRSLLDDPRIHDPPEFIGRPTVHWPAPGPGRLRVDYLLPSRHFTPLATMVGNLETERAEGASRHVPLWMDIAIGHTPEATATLR